MWRSASNQAIGEFMSRQLGSGGALLELLSAKNLDKSAIKSAVIQIAEVASRKHRRASVTEIAKGHGFRPAATQPAASWASKDEVDV